MMKKLALILLSSAALTSACAPMVAQRGNMLEDYQLEEVKPGTSTRSEVFRALGSPTTRSTFDENVWYYIGQETEKRGILDPKIVKERIFMVAFDENGTLEALEEVDRERLNIPYVRAKTPTHGNDTTALQEFFGNLGKFNPQKVGNAAETGGGI